MRRFVAALLAGATVIAAARATAAPSARLVYVRDTGAEDCPEESALRAAVAARLGYEPFFPHASSTLYAEVSKKDGVYRAKIKLVDETNSVRGARDLEHRGDTCADIVDAMALSMSIAIDAHSLVGPRRTTEEEPAPAPSAEPTPEAPPPVEPAPTVAPSPPPAAASAREVVPIFGAALAGWAGAAPAPNVGALLFGGLRYRAVSLFLEGRADFPASTDVTRGRVSTGFVGGSFVPCLGVGWVSGCGVLTLGRLAAEGEGLARSESDAALHGFAGGRAALAVPLTSRLHLRLALDVLALLTPVTLRIDRVDVYEMPRVAGGLSAGLAVHFP